MLKLSNVKKRFKDKQVLNDVSFHVPEHSVFGFVGQNGAGKTTTMKILLGLLKADSGEILVNGERVAYGNTSTNRFVGYLPDVPEFYSFMTPREYLNFCGTITGMSNAAVSERTEELLELVGLSEEKRRIKGYSRGMKQRLGIAQALLHRPKLLICDEPTSALDPVGRKAILDILVSAKEQTTVLFSTHILGDVERICDEVAFLHQGHIVLQGKIDDIKQTYTKDYELSVATPHEAQQICAMFNMKRQSATELLLENADSEQVFKLLSALGKKQIEVQSFQRRENSLETLFMETVGQ